MHVRPLLLLLLAASVLGCGPRAPGTPAASPTAAPAPLLLDEATWRLRAQVVYRNTGTEPASVTLEMPLPRDHAPWQKVETLSGGARQVRDAHGNRLAVFVLEDVPPGGQEVREVATRVRRTAVVFDPDARRIQPPGEDLAPYLRAEERILADDPVIQETARALTAHEENAYYRLVKLYDFVRTLDFQLTKQAQGDREALRSRVVQCADAAGLLVSLSRAVGIPARYVAGVYLRPEEPSTTTTHAWAEAYVAPYGWLPMDPTMGRFADTRGSRLGQLEPAYVPVWEGRASAGFAASGSPGDFRLTFHHQAEGRRVRATPALPVPALSGNPDQSAVLPGGRAGELLAQAGSASDPAEKVRLLRQALQAEPDSMALYRLLVGASDPDALQAELEAEPARPAVSYALGLLALRGERWSQAEAWLDRAGDDFPVQHARAELFLRTHQPSRAAEALRLALGQVVTRTLVENALELFASIGDQAGLLQVASDAVRRFPDIRDFRIAEAQATFRLGDHAEAERDFAELRRQDPRDGVVPGLLGALYLQDGQVDRARELLRESLGGDLDDREREFFQDLLEGL